MTICAVRDGPLTAPIHIRAHPELWKWVCLPCYVKTRDMTTDELTAYRTWITAPGMDRELNRRYDQLRVRSVPEIRRLIQRANP